MNNEEEKFNEPAAQFHQIWEEYHDPILREERKMKSKRKQRAEIKQQDSGV